MASPPALPTRSKPVITNPSRQKIDVSKALKLRLQGNTFEEIGSIFGCTASAVHQSLSSFEQFINKIEPGQLTAYSEQRADLFNVVEHHLTGSLLDPDAMAKASLNNRAYALKVIHDSRRLQQGESTSNVSVLGKLVLAAEERLGASGPLPHLTKVHESKQKQQVTEAEQVSEPISPSTGGETGA